MALKMGQGQFPPAACFMPEAQFQGCTWLEAELWGCSWLEEQIIPGRAPVPVSRTAAERCMENMERSQGLQCVPSAASPRPSLQQRSYGILGSGEPLCVQNPGYDT